MPLRRAALLLLLALALPACKGQKKKDLADFAAARQLFDDAKTAVSDGRLDAAHEAHCQMETVLIKLRIRSGGARFGDENVPPGRIIDGQSVEAWQDEWKGEFREHVAREFDQLHQRALQGELDWLRARSFFTGYGNNALDERWQKAVDDVEAGKVGRAGDEYVWSCNSVLDGYCDALRATLAPKLAHPLTAQSFITQAGRDAMFGLVEVEAWAGTDATYQQIQVGGGQLQVVPSDKATMPTRLTVSIGVKTRRGHSSWDGKSVAVVEVEAPPTFSVNETETTWRRQVARLEEKMAGRVQAIEKQTLTE